MFTSGRALTNGERKGSSHEPRTHASKAAKTDARRHAPPTDLIQRARLSPASLTAPDVLQLQRTVGNRAAGRLLSPAPVGGSRAGLPGNLKAGIENISGVAMDDVRVHYNSPKPDEVQASAYTRGSDIYVSPGQERHLPHEAWHVVQQKQGRVRATEVHAKGAPVNDDPALEREADQMGARASRASISGHDNLPAQAQAAQPEVVQRAKASTDYGEFKTTKFAPMNDSGVDIVLKFTPDKTKVDAAKIALVQSVKATNEAGTAYAINPTMANNMVGKGKGEGYVIDASGKTNNPIYFDTKNLGPAQDLKDTPASNARGTPNVGVNTHYELGYCFKQKPADPDKKTHPAALSDTPQGMKKKGAGMMFETTALAIDGADKGKYYGSVKWGYKVGGTDAAPKVEAKDTFDITEASKGTPTANFIEAAKLWNVGKTSGTLEVNPTSPHNKTDAYVEYEPGSTGPKRLAKGTRLRMVEPIKGTSEPMIRAEVLDAAGKGTGTIVKIFVSDVKDTGSGGTPNKPLPV